MTDRCNMRGDALPSGVSNGIVLNVTARTLGKDMAHRWQRGERTCQNGSANSLGTGY